MNGQTGARVLRSPEEIETIRVDWMRLGSLPAQNWELYWSSIREREPPRSPYVVALFEGQHLRAALPGWLEAGQVKPRLGYWLLRGIPVRRVVLPASGLLGEGDDDTLGQLTARVVADLVDRRADMAVFEYARCDSALHRAATRVPVARWMRDRVPERQIHRQLNLPSTFKQFDRDHKGLLQKVRRFERTFEGRFEHRLLTREEEIDVFCESVEAVARRTYQRALGEGFLNSREDHVKMRAAARQGAWRAFITLVDGKALAFWSGCQFGADVQLWWTGYDAGYREFSPGLVSSARMVERFIGAGVAVVDFGGGDAPYKERLCDAAWWEESACFYAPGPKGTLVRAVRGVNTAIGNLGRTRLKSLSNRLKTPWRRLLARRVSPQETGQDGPTPGRGDA